MNKTNSQDRKAGRFFVPENSENTEKQDGNSLVVRPSAEKHKRKRHFCRKSGRLVWARAPARAHSSRQAMSNAQQSEDTEQKSKAKPNSTYLLDCRGKRKSKTLGGQLTVLRRTMARPKSNPKNTYLLSCFRQRKSTPQKKRSQVQRGIIRG